jgi:hypothetical protein
VRIRIKFVNFGQFKETSGSGSALPKQIHIQANQINADLDPQHWFNPLYFYFTWKHDAREVKAVDEL